MSEKKVVPGPNYLEGNLIRDALHDVFERENSRIEAMVQSWIAGGLDQVYLVGCGGSLAIMEPVKWLLDRFSPLAVDAYNAFEFVNRVPRRLTSRSAAVLASHSGTTEEVLTALQIAKQHGARTAGLSVPATPLTDGAGTALTYTGPVINLQKLYTVYLIAAHLIIQTGDKAEGQRLLAALKNLPETLHGIKESAQERGRQLAARYKETNLYYVVGTGPLAGVAYQFSICILLEMQWIHAADINAGEFRHGPYEIVEQGTPMIFLVGEDASRPVAERALAFAQRYGADTIVFDTKEMPAIDPDLSPFAIIVGLQWFAWHLSVERDHPLSTRRYMWKVPY